MLGVCVGSMSMALHAMSNACVCSLCAVNVRGRAASLNNVRCWLSGWINMADISAWVVTDATEGSAFFDAL